MKPFDLEKALAGEPVQLRCGLKAYVKFVLENVDDVRDVLNGWLVNSVGLNQSMSWRANGKANYGDGENNEDIIGMWQEPRPRVQLDLPAPLRELKQGQEYHFIAGSFNLFRETFIGSCFDFDRLNDGRCFATKEDAQEWLDAMQNARR